MDWLDRDLQHEILLELSKIYPDDQQYDLWIDTAYAQTIGTLESEKEEEKLIVKRFANMAYLAEHNLIELKDETQCSVCATITAKGIDFLAEDGGLSAILGVVTVKLHSNTIKTLLAIKIEQANIPETEKSELKKSLATIKETALAKLTEKAIDSADPMKIIGWFKTGFTIVDKITN